MLADIERIHGSPIIDGVCTSGGNETPILESILQFQDSRAWTSTGEIDKMDMPS
jgi:hypothetical protein